MLTREELKETVTRIFDSLRNDKEHDGLCDCKGIHSCSKCPFDGSYMYCFDEESLDNVLNSLEYIERWAQEHPPITYEQKYKEVFGVDPVHTESETKCYICPKLAGLSMDTNCNAQSCAECKKKFWQSEYKQPKKGQTDGRDN